MAHENMLIFASESARLEFYKTLKSEGLQYCPICCTSKPKKDFHKSAWGNSGQYCIACKRTKNREAYHVPARKEAIENRRRMRVYGLSPDEYYDMRYVVQKNRCGCCKKDFSKMPSNNIHIDQDHRTGNVRAILCHNCNTICSEAIDDPKVLEDVAKYLLRHALVKSTV